MHQAVKRAAPEFATDLDNVELVPSNDTNGSPVHKNIEELRDKIKSARLEKLMARQLETELAIDEIDFDETKPDDTGFESADTPSIKDDTSNYSMISEIAKTALHSSDTYDFDDQKPETTQLQRTKRICEELVQETQTGAKMLDGLAEQAVSIASYLQSLEKNIALHNRTQSELEEVKQRAEQVERDNIEAKGLAEKQKKQIEMLETMRKSSMEGQECAKRELSQLQKTVRRKDNEITDLKTNISELNRERDSIRNTVEKLELDSEQDGQKLSKANSQLRDRDMKIAKLSAERNALSKQNEQIQETLDEIRAKYNELNKRSLEQQSQQFGKIHELENTVRDLKRQIEVCKQEKAELSVELSAANNLLVLHEEMITTLSPDALADIS